MLNLHLIKTGLILYRTCSLYVETTISKFGNYLSIEIIMMNNNNYSFGVFKIFKKWKLGERGDHRCLLA